MKRLFTTDSRFSEKLMQIRGPMMPLPLLLNNQDKIASVQQTIDTVGRHGDEAVCELTAQFDKVHLTAETLRVSVVEIQKAFASASSDDLRAIETAIQNVREYQQHIKVYQTKVISREGVELRTRYLPIERVGICVPGASAPLPSTVIMSAVPAQGAGVKEIVVVSPPRHEGSVHPLVLACCHMLGITEVYRIGGAQAVAALAIGTKTIRRVDKIVGPGNIYVQLAKKLLFGVVDIDSFAGPSEIVVLADESADARFVASDLIGQAEHDPGSGILVTTSETLADRVDKELAELLAKLERRAQAQRCLEENGALIIARDMAEAIGIVNRLAPEHLSVQTKDYESDAEQCVTAGAIFIGPFTSEALGDYVAGPSHVLPTGGTARFFSPLNVMDFMRHSSMIKYNREALKRIYPAIEVLTAAERLPGHQLSAKVRLE